MEKDFTVDDIISVMKKTRKTDPLFKPLKKLKTAIESIGLENISFVPTERVLVFHFGLGNELDREFLLSTNPQHLSRNISIIPGHSYCILEFDSVQHACHYLSARQTVQDQPLFFQQISFQNLKRTIVYLFCKEMFQRQQQLLNIPNCESKYTPGSIPGLILAEEIISKEEELALLEQIDQGQWEKLNNRRVQHHGYVFKYGRNQVDKDENQGKIPPLFDALIKKLEEIPILRGMNFDQLTINDYFAGNGIPAHFDTHSPFQEVFIAVSLLSGIVMEWRKYDGEQKSVFLRQRSVVIFSGQARYAWTHAISCRKMDKIDNQLVHRSRRLSLTFRKIKFTPCQCPYYFYCDSQGYNQETMKKNNPLLAKYMSKQHAQSLSKLSAIQIEVEYVEKAYNGFGFDFHNKVIGLVQSWLERDVKEGDFVLDIGCGNGEYQKYLSQGVFYFGVQKCTTMVPIENQLFMDCKKLSFKSSTFDKIIFVAVLHHLASEETRMEALKECFRVLRKQGIMYLTVLSFEQKKQTYSSPEIILQYCLPSNKLAQRQKIVPKQVSVQVPRVQERGQIFKRYYHLFTINEMSHLLKETGFSILECESQTENLIFKVMKE